MNNLQLSPETLAALIAQLGDNGFAQQLLSTLQHIARVDHLSLVHMSEQNQISYLFSANNDACAISKPQEQLYLTIYYRLDPNVEFLQHLNSPDEVLLRNLKAEDIHDEGYRKLWYEQMGIRNRLSLITLADQGIYCLNLFRQQELFSDEEVEQINHYAKLLCSLVVKHSRIAGALPGSMTRENQIQNLEERLQALEPDLTQREKEVCARIMLGVTSEGIGLDLGIKKQSVLTYRKRAYARLNISSQNELFSRCLGLTR